MKMAPIVLVLGASLLLASDSKTCLDLSAAEDSDVHSASGIQVTISGSNHCSEDLDGSRCRFRVSALGPGGNVIAGQSGSFGGTIGPQERVETRVFVQCDPERVRSVKVEAQ